MSATEQGQQSILQVRMPPCREANGKWLAFLVGCLWLPILTQLSGHWSLYDQYQYGFAVPLLCAFLAWRNWKTPSNSTSDSLSRGAAPDVFTQRFPTFCFVAVLASLLLSATLILQESSPLWRFPTYALVLQGIAITFGVLYVAGGAPLGRRLMFPIAFILVAVPWPTPVESWVIGALTRLNTVAVVEFLNLLGFAAFPHGNIIEVSTGMVGIDEACSGIRSTQAVIMLALFFGEFYRHSIRRRITLLLSGLGIAVILNVLRTTILAGLADHGGIALSERWHDATGLAVLVACFALTWLISTLHVAEQTRTETPSDSLSKAGEIAHPTSSAPRQIAAVSFAAVLLFCVVPLGASELWFRLHERKHFVEPELMLSLPKGKTEFRENPISDGVRSQLQYDSGSLATWKNGDGTRWQVFHFRWNPAKTRSDRVRIQLAKSHRPEICIPAGGRTLRQEFVPTVIRAGDLELPFRTYEFQGSREGYQSSVFVFFCVREDHTPAGMPANMRESHASRFAAAWNGNRGLGQRSIQVAISGARDIDHARESFKREMSEMLHVPDGQSAAVASGK